MNKKEISYLKQQARRIWGWSQEKKDVRARTLVKDAAESRHRLYVCEGCREIHEHGNMQVDHIAPVELVTGWNGDWNGWLGRLWCGAAGYHHLCKPCHQKKSIAENKLRPKRGKAKCKE